ncbi:uncharacterized protein P884DRAFT_205825 [Thermothelomyces heterothallicus CBS 202.75]|uniref:uncharacterized protein n=1 Tax=Thermothelomyces heterothallicus CBS 202.75 TaxID=1149848 RepID=UPI0037424908
MDRFIQRSKRAQNLSPANTAIIDSNGRQACEPLKKKARIGEVKDSDAEDTEPTPDSIAEIDGDLLLLKESGSDESTLDPELSDHHASEPRHQTAFESSLPAVATGEKAVEEYEVLCASQISQNDAEAASAWIGTKQWVRGRSSIYVDAFHLALDTVLEDESHLFDAKEKSVFEHWRSLGYEAQYL